MGQSQVKIQRMPLDSLWDDDGFFGEPIRYLKAEDVRTLMREGPFRFVEVKIGSPLRWIKLEDCFDHWRIVQRHLVNGDRIFLDDYPAGFVWTASEWSGRSAERLVVLEKHH